MGRQTCTGAPLALGTGNVGAPDTPLDYYGYYAGMLLCFNARLIKPPITNN